MANTANAPILSRAKSWQFIGLGLSGWCTLYSIALLSSGATGVLAGNAQGGCFAATMTLAGMECRRYRKSVIPSNPLQWTENIPTEHLNQTIARVVKAGNSRLEPCHRNETELGFGVRTVSAGRTMVFETEHWRKPVIDLSHVQTTEENRKKVSADVAIIVGAGKPDDAAVNFAKNRPLDFLVGEELKNLIESQPAPPSDKT